MQSTALQAAVQCSRLTNLSTRVTCSSCMLRLAVARCSSGEPGGHSASMARTASAAELQGGRPEWLPGVSEFLPDV